MQLISAPSDFGDTIGAMPDGVRPSSRGTLDFAMLFVRSGSELRKKFPRLRDRLESNGALWVSWPKKASGVETDLSEGIVSRGHLICPQHAWRFSTATGEQSESSQYCLVTYAVRVVGDRIEIDPRPRAAGSR